MPKQTRIVGPGPGDRSVVTADGQVLHVPRSWSLLPPGDAGLTRKLKSLGPTWTVKQKKGRRTFSLGVWADGKQIAEAKRLVQSTRADAGYQKRLDASRRRREVAQQEYVEDFESEVRRFLAFADMHGEMAHAMAEAITQHATPVGSGTVARTQRIPIERRVEAAVIAWMRHQTTVYDDMTIQRRRGARREVRRQLAAASRRLLQRYRRGEVPDDQCPLALWFTSHSKS